jgi:hypothetical protein
VLVICEYKNILFAANLVSGLLGVLTTSGENWRFFPFYLSFWLTAGSSISFYLFLTQLSRTYVVVFTTNEGVSLMLFGLLKESTPIFYEDAKVFES